LGIGFRHCLVCRQPRWFHLPQIQNFASINSDRPKPVEALLPMAFSKDLLQEAMGEFDYFGLARVAFACRRVVGSLLFQVSPYNSVIATSAVCVLLFVGIAACLIPARRAASVDPMEALRRE
jgi:hypothetical protein